MAQFLQFLKEWGALSVAALSLIVAIVSLIKSFHSQRLQNKIYELDEKLKNYELEKIAKVEAEKNNSCVEARIVKVGKNYKVKIWNSGNIVVYNVSAVFEQDSGLVLINNNKMPFEMLEPQKGFEVSAIHYGGVPKFKIITIWFDESKTQHQKEQFVDI